MSTPRWWPPSYSPAPASNGRRTGPVAGQLQAHAVGLSASAAAVRSKPIDTALVVREENTTSRVAAASAVVKTDYSESR
jgi:hypothetical protein